MKKHLSAALSAVAITLLLSGCTGDTGAGSTAPAEGGKSGEPWHDEVKPAASEAKLGSAGSPCTLPVVFDVAKSWKPQSVTADGPLAGLAKQGAFTSKCEIDAKPAGNIGFLRVWANSQGGETPRQALDAFLAADRNVSDQQFRETTAGKVPAAEVTYIKSSPATDTKKRERALAVATPRAAVVFVLGGLDSDEHQEMLPAYVLAKQSVTLAP